jgi:uncharacterized membrane protein YoaK (UPF0700 family)
MGSVLHTPEAIFSLRHTPSWLLLSSSSGMVNGLAFLACAQYVTHVTGTATRLGVEAGVALEYAVVVFSFIAGATCSVLPLQYRVYRQKRPLWAVPLGVVALTLIGIAFAGPAGAFGSFGEEETISDPPFILLSLLAFATGLQNAAVATCTGLIVRSTHLTGPATDLGIHLGVAFIARGTERRNALRGAILRGGKVMAFVGGAVFALPLAQSTGYLSFLFPAVFVLIATGLSFKPEWNESNESEIMPAASEPEQRSRLASRSLSSQTIV